MLSLYKIISIISLSFSLLFFGIHSMDNQKKVFVYCINCKKNFTNITYKNHKNFCINESDDHIYLPLKESSLNVFDIEVITPPQNTTTKKSHTKTQCIYCKYLKKHKEPLFIALYYNNAFELYAQS